MNWLLHALIFRSGPEMSESNSNISYDIYRFAVWSVVIQSLKEVVYFFFRDRFFISIKKANNGTHLVVSRMNAK